MLSALVSLFGFILSITMLFLLFLVVKGLLFKRRIWARTEELLTALDGSEQLNTEEADLEHLPEPVKRYLDIALDFTKPSPGAVTITHSGRFRLDAKQEWTQIKGDEIHGASEKGFIWRAKIKISPILWLSVCDSYRSREGEFVGMLMSALKIVHGFGSETDISALTRFLAESVLIPHVYMPGNDVKWTAIDEHSAHVSITDGKITSSGVMTFGENGLPVKFETEDYYQMEKDYTFVQRRWRLTYGEYKSFEGITVPTLMESSWLEDSLSPAFSYGVYKVKSVNYR